MGELLDLILDFERKLLGLVRDLFINPKRIADSIVAKDKEYLSAFKFYTFSMSVWIILYQVGNPYFDFFPQNYVLPHRLVSYMESQQNFFFLVAPFAGLIEFFLPVAILNWLLFRKRPFNWLNHFTMGLYIGGILLLYEFFALFIAYMLEDVLSDMFEFTVIILIMVIPALYFGYVYARIFGRRIFLSALKPFLVVMITGYLFATLFLEQPFHELLHRKILYGRYDRYEIDVPDSSSFASYHYNDSLPWAVVPQLHGRIVSGNPAIIARLVDSTQSFDYRLLNTRTGAKTILRPGEMLYSQSFIINEIDSPRQYVIVQNRSNSVFTDTACMSIVDENGMLLAQKKFSDHISIITRLIQNNGQILFTGNSRADHKPVLGEFSLSDNRIVSTTVIGDKDRFVDDIEPSLNTSDPGVELVMAYHEQSGLKAFTWMKGEYGDGAFRKEKELMIYQNAFNPAPNFTDHFLHKGELVAVNDSISIASFQVMTDSSFAINVTRVNRKQGTTDWNQIITLPFDMIYNDEVLADEKNIYLLGRAIYIFSNGWSQYYRQVPYITVLDIEHGNQVAMHMLPVETESERFHLTADLHSIYDVTSSAYRKDSMIVWSLEAVHMWEIDLTKMRRTSP